MTWTEADLLKAIAADIASAAGPRVPLAWRPDGSAYSAAEIGIHRDLTPDQPGASVTLADYVVSDDVGGEDSVIGLQVRISSKSRDQLKAIATDVFERWHGRQRCTLSGITITGARRASGTPLGQDRNGRLERTENYYLTVARPTPTRT